MKAGKRQANCLRRTMRHINLIGTISVRLELLTCFWVKFTLI
jgi:hypothetical protein